jgi:Contractile injection system tape measure protein
MHNKHIIGQVTIEIQGVDAAGAGKYQQVCSRQIRSAGFLDALSRELDRLGGDDVVVKIPRLEIELQLHEEEQFGSVFLEALRKVLARQTDEINLKAVSTENNLISLALHFLGTGALPWNTSPQQKLAVQKLFTEAPVEELAPLLDSMEQHAAQQTEVWIRFLYACGPDRIKEILARRYGFSTELLRWLAVQESNELSNNKIPVWQIALQCRHWVAQGDAAFMDKIEKFTGSDNKLTFQSVTGSPNPPSLQLMDQDTANSSVETSIFIRNAGLVLLAPFLPLLFERAGLVENRQFVSETARDTGIHLLQYLVTGDVEPWEFDLLLNKILCAVPENRPINRNAELTEFQCAEAEKMMEEAIRQWAVLKKTSAWGLREMFLQRDGKLVRNGGHWQLRVERKTVDVLLERLPMGWGFSVIRLPWMEEMLYVEW